MNSFFSNRLPGRCFVSLAKNIASILDNDVEISLLFAMAWKVMPQALIICLISVSFVFWTEENHKSKKLFSLKHWKIVDFHHNSKFTKEFTSENPILYFL